MEETITLLDSITSVEAFSVIEKFYPKFHDIFNTLLNRELKKNQDAQQKEKESVIIINFFSKTKYYASKPKDEISAPVEYANHRGKFLRALLALDPDVDIDDILSFMSFNQTYMGLAKKLGKQANEELQKIFWEGHLYWRTEPMTIDVLYHLLVHNLIPDTRFSDYLSQRADLFYYMKSLNGTQPLAEIISENTTLNRFFLKKDDRLMPFTETDYIVNAQKILAVKVDIRYSIN